MKLYLMRHGEATNIAASDAARPLTANGIARTEQAAQVLSGMKIQPAALFSSPRVRAHQTAEIVAKALGVDLIIRDELDFEFNGAAVQRIIEGFEADAEIFCVGHNPSMSEVIRYMTGASVGLKKGAVACIDLDPALLRGAELVWLATPKVFGALGS